MHLITIEQQLCVISLIGFCFVPLCMISFSVAWYHFLKDEGAAALPIQLLFVTGSVFLIPNESTIPLSRERNSELSEIHSNDPMTLQEGVIEKDVELIEIQS